MFFVFHNLHFRDYLHNMTAHYLNFVFKVVLTVINSVKYGFMAFLFQRQSNVKWSLEYFHYPSTSVICSIELFLKKRISKERENNDMLISKIELISICNIIVSSFLFPYYLIIVQIKNFITILLFLPWKAFQWQ